MRPMGWRAMKSRRAFSTSPSAAMRCSSEGDSTVPGQMALTRTALLDEIDRERFSKADYCGFGRAVDKPIRRAFDAGSAAGHINDAALFRGRHRGDERAARAIHRLHVEIERKIPVRLRAIEDRALVNEAGAIEENVESAQFGGKGVDRVDVANVERAGFDRWIRRGEFFEKSSLISVARLVAPSRAKAAVVAAPMPWPAAVMSAVFPCRRPVVTGGVGSLSFKVGRVRVVDMAGLARVELATSTFGG